MTPAQHTQQATAYALRHMWVPAERHYSLAAEMFAARDMHEQAADCRVMARTCSRNILIAEARNGAPPRSIATILQFPARRVPA